MAAVQLTAKLYGTKCCHLCEEAEKILKKAGITAVNIDIVEVDSLLEKYRLRIPVLQRFDSNAELDWPFDAATVASFFKQSG